jgi:hypothetical protein
MGNFAGASPQTAGGGAMTNRDLCDYNPPPPKFVAIRATVMRGAELIARAVSKTMAKRIANALNKHAPNREGV